MPFRPTRRPLGPPPLVDPSFYLGPPSYFIRDSQGEEEEVTEAGAGAVFSPCRSLERFARPSLWKESKFAQPLVRKKQTANGTRLESTHS